MIKTSSARVAIAIATANGMRVPEWCAEQVSTGGHRGTLASLAHGMNCGQVLAAVERSPLAVRSWLLLAYGVDGYASSRALHIVTGELYSCYARQRTVRADPPRIAAACGAVVSDLRQCYRTPSRPGAGPGEYMRAIGARRDQWRDWATTVAALQGIVGQWDREGLAPVAAVLDLEAQAA